jgi:hypothetical protein
MSSHPGVVNACSRDFCRADAAADCALAFSESALLRWCATGFAQGNHITGIARQPLRATRPISRMAAAAIGTNVATLAA